MVVCVCVCVCVSMHVFMRTQRRTFHHFEDV